MKTSVVKTCNSESGNTNCDMMDVTVEVYDKASGEKIVSQTIKRVYTHFTETKNFTAGADFILPEDTIGFAYETEGRRGISGNSTSATSNYLTVNTRSCGYDYQPNSSGTACVACPAPSGTKQYRSGDCPISTCPTGQKVNSAQNGCEAITCPSGQVLQGDSCVDDISPEQQAVQNVINGCASRPTRGILNSEAGRCCLGLANLLNGRYGRRASCQWGNALWQCFAFYSTNELITARNAMDSDYKNYCKRSFGF